MRRLPIPPERRFIADLSWASLRVPRCLMQAGIAIPRALAARAALAAPRPAWPVLFAKAYALTAMDRPALRRGHASLPWPQLIELDHAPGCVVVERTEPGEPRLIMAHFAAPHRASLRALTTATALAKTVPLSPNPWHDRYLALPWPLRRLVLRAMLALGWPLLKSGGVYAVSALGGQGAAILDSVSVLPMFISFGPIGPDGGVLVHIAFDHRVMDGAEGAFALRGIEAALEGPLSDEMERMRGAGA